MAWDNKSRRRKELPSNWHKLRARILARDNHTCVLCGAKANQVDHIGKRLDHSSDNLRSLCWDCHATRTGRQGGKTKRRPKPPTKRTPEPHPGLRNRT